MRAILAALFICLFALPASAHLRHRHHNTNPMVVGLGMGFAHMMRSADRHHRHYVRHRRYVRHYRRRVYHPHNEMRAAFVPFEPGPFSMAFGAAQDVVDTAVNTGVEIVGRTTSVAANVAMGAAVAVHHIVRSVGEIVAHPKGCPHTEFCGCGAADYVFGYPRRDLWLAANWFKFPPAQPGPGMVAVRQHHVFVILKSYGDGTVLAYDANSGHHLTRIHRVSLHGYSVHDPHGTRA